MMARGAMGPGGGIPGTVSATAEEQAGQVQDWALLWRLLKLLAPYSKQVACSVLCAVADMGLQILGPVMISLAIDRYLFVRTLPQSALNAWLPPDRSHGLAALSLIYLAIQIAGCLVQTLQAYIAIWTGQRAMADLRDRVFTHLQRLAISFYDANPTGRLVTRVTNDVEALSELFANGIVGLIANLAMVVFFLGGMLLLSARLTSILAVVLPVFAALTFFFRQKVTPTQQRVRILIARINAMIAEHVNGIAVLQLFNREEASGREFERINRQHMAASKGWVTANAWFMPSIELMGTLSQAGLLWVGAALLGGTGGNVTIGVLVAFLQYGAKFLRPILDLSERYGVLQTSIVSAERVFRLLDTPALPAESSASPAPADNDIEFDRVWFAYRGEEWVLQDVSFRVGAGESLAVVGHTGAGKTTLTNLLLRFYEPQRGSIRLGGVDIRSLDVTTLRRMFGVVLQDTYVHEGSVLENIHFGLEQQGTERACAAARLVQVDEILAPQGLNTQVTERGDNLSAGQKQLVGIARAICRSPNLLILDEATSDVDVETEGRIQRALTGLLEARTSVIIAHRLTTVLRADRILLLHKGSVREMGTHAELVAQRGLYWRLYQLQFGPQQARAREAAQAVS